MQDRETRLKPESEKREAPARTDDGRGPSRRDVARGLLGALGLALAPLPALAQDIRFFRIGTGAADSTNFLIGALLANAISNPPGSRPCEQGGSCGVPGLIAVAQSTAGAVYNVQAIGDGQLDSGLTQADIAYWAYHGQGPFISRGEVPFLSAIASLYPEAMHVVVRSGAGIAGFTDLKGKRVAIGPPLSGANVDARLVLAAHGLSSDDLTLLEIQPGPASDMMARDELEALFLIAGHPVALVAEVVERVGIELLPLVGTVADDLAGRYPFLSRGAIPAGIYGDNLWTPTLVVRAQWLVSTRVGEETVYGITRALWHEVTRKLLDRGHPEAKAILPETALQGLAIPLHPGARRYYEEAGMMRPSSQPADGSSE